jgi:cell division protein FtsA
VFNFLKKNKDYSIVALDIGTEFVKAITFSIDEGKGNVLGIGQVRQKLGDIQYGAVMDIGSVINNCKKAISMAEREAKMPANQMIMGIAGELVKGMTVSLSYQRDKADEKINLAELKNIVHKVQWKTFDLVRNKISEETGFPEIDIKLVNAAIVDVRIDGYKVSNPIGFQGKEVKISVFNAFAPLVHFGALETIASELENLDLLSIISQPYAISRSLGFEEGGSYSAIFIDVGGGTTDLAIVRDGCIEGTKMFAIGGRTFTKRIATEFNISFNEAEKIKLAYSADELDKNSTSAIRKILQNDVNVWLSGVELCLHEFNLDFLPFKILLSGGGSFLPEIQEALNQRPWTKNLNFTRPPVIKPMQPKDISNIIDQTGRLNTRQDITPMALANAALDLAGEDPPLTTLLKKVIGILKV